MAGPEPQPEPLGEEAIISQDGTVLEFNIGCFSPPDCLSVAIGVLAETEKGFLACVPGSAWHKKTTNRKLPVGSLLKPLSLSVTGCDPSDRTVALEGSSVHVWLGWLGAGFDSYVSFSADLILEVDFEEKDTKAQCLPFADSLEQAAMEKFGIGQKAGEDPNEDRITALEAKFDNIQASLEMLVQGQGGGGYVTGREADSATDAPKKSGKGLKANPAASAKTGVAAPAASAAAANSGMELPGLDPGAVSAALNAGVPFEHLMTMSRVVMQKPEKVNDPQQKTQANPKLVVGDSSEEEEDPALSQEPVAAAVVQLTKILSKMNSRQKNDPLEESMDFSSGGSGSVDGGGGLARKHAAVLRALKQAFKNDPKKLWTVMESNLMEDYALSSVLPNSGALGFSARGWPDTGARSKPIHEQPALRGQWQAFTMPFA